MKKSNYPGELLILTSVRAHLSARGHVVLTQKFNVGMQAYADRWPGPVTAMARVCSEADSNLDHEEVLPEKYSFAVERFPDSRSALIERVRQASLVVGGIARVSGVRQVAVRELSLKTQCQIIVANTRNPVLRLRRMMWITRDELRTRRWLSRIAGIQCNGTPTFHAYRHLNPRTMLFFDNRILNEDLISEDHFRSRLKRLLSKNPLRLVFSGRLIEIKGVDAIPRIADELRRLGVDFRFDICGAGACEQLLRREIKARQLERYVRLRGVLRYREELLPLIQDHIDLFVCPHVQGDPACTYVETLACGVPIVGYDNEAWAGMSSLCHAGWTTPMKKPELLAAEIARLDKERSLIAQASYSARDFAAEHLFHETMDRRVEHFLSCLQGPTSTN